MIKSLKSNRQIKTIGVAMMPHFFRTSEREKNEKTKTIKKKNFSKIYGRHSALAGSYESQSG